MLTSAAWLLILLCTGQARPAAEPAEQQLGPEQLARWTEFYQREVQQYEIFYDGERGIKLALQPEPVFRWAAPTAGNEYNGAMFVWTHDGRPEVVGGVWSAHYKVGSGKRSISHSLHSLAIQPLHANRNEVAWWTPTKPGIELKPIVEAPLPADSDRFRLIQMRSLAREFTATTFLDDLETVKVEMRMLPQPIYRFESGLNGPKDGAIFLFLNDWDPELLLVIESRETADGRLWHYAPARFCYNSALLKHKGQDVWKYDRGGPMSDRNHTYLSIHGASIVNWQIAE
jgi:hypothetical protein